MDTTVIVADLAARLRSAGAPDGLWVSAADYSNDVRSGTSTTPFAWAKELKMCDA